MVVSDRTAPLARVVTLRTRLPTATGLALIRRWEGFRAAPYLDAAGVPTIGYGTIRYEDGRPVTLADPPIGRERAEALLLDHIARLACPSVLRLIAVPLDDPQYDALVSFTYNLGGGALQASTLRRKVNRGEYEAAAAEFPKWCWAGGRRLAGLLARREAERALWLRAA